MCAILAVFWFGFLDALGFVVKRRKFKLSTGSVVRIKILLNSYFLIVSGYPTSQSPLVGLPNQLGLPNQITPKPVWLFFRLVGLPN
jgi:hypothetical protein